MLGMSISPQTRAEETKSKPDCKQVIDAADKAIEAQKKEIDLCRTSLLIYDQQNKALLQDLNASNKALSSWYRNPFIMMGLGLLGGVVTGVIISK